MNSQLRIRQTLGNRLRGLLLIGFMGGYLALLGGLLWGRAGLLALLTGGLIFLLLVPIAGPRTVMRLLRARRLEYEDTPELFRLAARIAGRAGLPQVPALYYLASPVPNAVTVGAGQESAIAVTDGLLGSLNRRELAGVLAHEISHAAGGDMLIMLLAEMFGRSTRMLSHIGMFLVFLNLPLAAATGRGVSWLAILLLVAGPWLSALSQLALSRTREYEADLGAVSLTGDPEGLAMALAKIDRGRRSWLQRLLLPVDANRTSPFLRTHPPTEERIRRLRELEPHPPAGRTAPEERNREIHPFTIPFP